MTSCLLLSSEWRRWSCPCAFGLSPSQTLVLASVFCCPRSKLTTMCVSSFNKESCPSHAVSQLLPPLLYQLPPAWTYPACQLSCLQCPLKAGAGTCGCAGMNRSAITSLNVKETPRPSRPRRAHECKLKLSPMAYTDTTAGKYWNPPSEASSPSSKKLSRAMTCIYLSCCKMP